MRSTAALASPLLSPFLALALIATLPAGAGCKSAREKAEQRAVETQTGGQVQLVDGGLILRTDAGVVALGENSKIPDDFPKTIPVYPGARVNMAARSAGSGGKPAWSLSLETGDEQPKVVAFYASG